MARRPLAGQQAQIARVSVESPKYAELTKRQSVQNLAYALSLRLRRIGQHLELA
jgi:hypothetical protein